jgi:ribonuclease HI
MDSGEQSVAKLEEMLARRGDKDLARLIDEEFTEFGRSGVVWRGPEVTAELAEPQRDDVHLSQLAVRRLGDGALLCTYESISPRGRTLRSSIWIRRDDSWRLTFHQGTPIPEGDT